MVEVLYSIERAFMKKTYESIDRHVDVESAYLPIREEARGCSDVLDEVPVADVSAIDENVRAVDPTVVVMNHRFPLGEAAFPREYPVVHIRHGASIGRGEIRTTNDRVLEHVALALAPGTRWAERYRDVARVVVVGIPEADEFVSAAAPRAKRVLYAPTNHAFGEGSFRNTAEHVIDVFADTDYELLFRPHPMDRITDPARALVERCRERIDDIPNIVFDEHPTPRESMHESDILISDYSGIVAEWLHSGRPLVQFTDIASDTKAVPEIGYATDRIDIETIDDLYRNGYPAAIDARVDRFAAELGIPMDGRAGERAAREVMACTP